MAQDTLLGFPAHTLPYRRGEFTTLLTVSGLPLRGRSFLCPIQFCVPDSLGILYFQGDQRMLEHKME